MSLEKDDDVTWEDVAISSLGAAEETWFQLKEDTPEDKLGWIIIQAAEAICASNLAVKDAILRQRLIARAGDPNGLDWESIRGGEIE